MATRRRTTGVCPGSIEMSVYTVCDIFIFFPTTSPFERGSFKFKPRLLCFRFFPCSPPFQPHLCPEEEESKAALPFFSILPSRFQSEALPPPSPLCRRMECRGTCTCPNSSSKSSFDCILFDLDDTLYSSDVGIGKFVRQNIEEFLQKTCGITAEAACTLRAELFRSHGSSLAGLRALGYDIHPDDYHSYVHGRLPYEVIKPDPLLRDLLQSIPQTKIIFTNSDQEHARKVLQRLGLNGGGCFDAVICFETLNPDASACPVVLKPSPSAFEVAVRVAGVEPRRTLFLDDSERNVAAGKALGLRTALVGKSAKSGKADYLLASVADLRRVIPEIWRGAEVNKAAAGVGGGQDKRKLRGGDLESILASSATPAPVEA